MLLLLVSYGYICSTGQMPDLSTTGEVLITKLPFLASLFLANTILAVFNLIPAFPMDGGRVFRAILGFAMDRSLATRIAASLGQFLAIVFVFLGFFYNFWLVFIGLFIYLGAGGEAAFEQTRSALSGLRVKDALMRRFTVLSLDATLNEAVDALLNSQEKEFIVVDSGKPVGLLTRDEIVKGLAEIGKTAPVSSFMKKDFLIVDPQTELNQFFQQVTESGQKVALVMERDSFLGLIDVENLEEILMIRKALKVHQ